MSTAFLKKFIFGGKNRLGVGGRKIYLVDYGGGDPMQVVQLKEIASITSYTVKFTSPIPILARSSKK